MSKPFTETLRALTIETFWRWVSIHYNCILRAGSEQCMLYDQEDLHWHLIEEEDELLVAQLVRGKSLIAELVIAARQITYVESAVQPDDTVLFQLVGDINGEPVPLYHFLMSHDYEEELARSGRQWTH